MLVNGRAQMFSGDFLLGFVLFFAAFTLILGLWGTTTREILSSENYLAMEDAGSDAIEKLVRTEGSPADWGETSASSIGLANQSRILNSNKVVSFTRMMRDDETGDCGGGYTKYECNGHLLGLGGYAFRLNMSYINGTTLSLNGTGIVTGRAPIGDSYSLTLDRTALLGGEIVKVYLTVWR